MLLNGGKLQRPPTTRESGVDDKPSGNHHHSRKGPTNQSYSAFAFCSAAGSALHVDSSDKSQGYQAHCPKHSTWSSARSAWSPRWPTARAPAAARLPSCNKVGPCCRLLPWYVLSHLWANDKMGLDGTGWLLCFRHPACSSPARTSTRPVARFLQQHAWFLGLGPFSQLHPLQLEVHRYKSTSPLYSPRRPSYTRICSHVFLTHAHMNQSTRLHPSKAPLPNR